MFLMMYNFAICKNSLFGVHKKLYVYVYKNEIDGDKKKPNVFCANSRY